MEEEAKFATFVGRKPADAAKFPNAHERRWKSSHVAIKGGETGLASAAFDASLVGFDASMLAGMAGVRPAGALWGAALMGLGAPCRSAHARWPGIGGGFLRSHFGGALILDGIGGLAAPVALIGD
jgi:hypothetical protein